MDAVTEITIFVLAALVGFEVISKVPTTLHTPLMSQTNAIHGIVLLGGLLVIGFSDSVLTDVIGVIAITLACFVGQLGDVFAVAKKTVGAFSAPLLAVFVLGLFVRRTTATGGQKRVFR